MGRVETKTKNFVVGVIFYKRTLLHFETLEDFMFCFIFLEIELVLALTICFH